jgi:general L-amino acid transport system permease protein
VYNQKRLPFWRDERFLGLLGQIIFLFLLLALLGFLFRNLLINLRQQGLGLGFSFMRLTSGFDIGEHLIPYDRSHTFFQAYLVGLLNTALVSILGIFFATLLGVFFGITRLSNNYLVQLLARSYIEFLRNIPLLVLLIFWYTGVFLKLPRVKEAVQLPGPILLSNRGVAIPWGIPTETFRQYIWFLGIGLLLAIAVFGVMVWQGRRTGRPPLSLIWGLLTFLIVSIIGWYVLPASPLSIDTPTIQGLRIAGGKPLSPEFMALLSGLAIYTSAFIADVVRAGIQSVSRGQVEASKSLGLTSIQTLRLVVFPQALRVIVPPLTSQYLNLIKNSSLAVAIGYPELFHVSGTILNQSGRAVEVITLVMATYLSISLLTSAFMNWYNRRVRLVER